MIVAFRRRILRPLDDLLGHLREALPPLTRSTLYSCLIRHGISNKTKISVDKLNQQKWTI